MLCLRVRPCFFWSTKTKNKAYLYGKYADYFVVKRREIVKKEHYVNFFIVINNIDYTKNLFGVLIKSV